MAVGAAVAMATERLVEPIEGVHRAISRRVFGVMGNSGPPLQRVHDTLIGAVYGSVRLVGVAVGIGLDAGLSVERHRTDGVQAAVNGLWGDDLAARGSRLAIEMGLRDRTGASVEIGPETLHAERDATANLVILVHGLGETEQCWIGDHATPGLMDELEADGALSAIPIRYNTGLHISENGSHLDRLIEELLSRWPVPVESIALVGHSMGGLVIRSACIAALASENAWVDKVGDVVTLGTPHQGAPLEKLVNVVAWGLSLNPQSRPIADYLNGRSAGIKDLRFGAIADEDWQESEIDSLLSGNGESRPLPAGIDHHFVTGVVTDDPDHPIGFALGDLMVRKSSGTAAKNLQAATTVVLGGTRHFDYLHNPVVTNRVLEWISSTDRLQRSAD